MNEQGVGGMFGSGRGLTGARRAAALAACAGLLWAGGCGRDAGEQALSDASITLASLNAGVGTPMPRETVAKGLQEVIAELQPLTSGSGAVAADASLLVSSAQRGLGLQTAGEAVRLQRRGLSRLPMIRAQLEAWTMHNAAATAASAYDPAPEFARIDESVRARQGEAERERANKAAIDAEVSGLLGQVAGRLAEAATLRGTAGELRLRIPGVSETEGLALTEQIRGLTREADRLEFEARGLKTQADRKNVDLRAAEVAIAKLEAQIDLLARSRAAVQTRQSAAQEKAAAARGAAQQAANALAALVDTATGPVPPGLDEVMAAVGGELELSPEEIFGAGPAALTPFMEETLAPKIADAARQLETAASTARKAGTLRRSGSQVAVGEAQQSLGDVRWAEANGLDAYAQVFEELVSAQPSLPSAAEYASRARASREAALAAKQAAYDAYQAAVQAYEGSGAKGDVAGRIEEVGRKLNAISKVVGKGVVDAEALSALDEPIEEEPVAEEPEPEEEPAAEPEAALDPEAELRAAIEAVYAAAAAGDYETVIAFVRPASADDESLVADWAEMARAMARLDTATETAFGAAFSDWAAESGDPMLTSFGNTGTVGGADPADLDLRVLGDEAVALTGIASLPEVRFARIDGEWRQLMETPTNPMVAAQMQLVASLAVVLGEVADGVEAGDLENNPAVGEEIKSRIMSLMQPPGGG